MIFIILILALILRLINLNQSLWLDEAVQAITAQRSLSFISEEIKGDFHPPLYHVLMHFWVRLFGSSEISLRLPSILFGVGTVFAVYLIAKVISDQWSGIRDQELSVDRNGKSVCCSLIANHWSPFPLAAALFMATAPFHIYYSQEARMYSLTTFLTALSMYFFLRLIDLMSRGTRSTKEEKFYLVNFTFYIFFTTLALYSDYFALLVLISQMIIGIMKREKRLITAWLAILFLYPLILPLFLTQVATGIEATKILPGWGKLVNLSFLKALPLTIIKFSIGRITVFNRQWYALLSMTIIIFYGWLFFKTVTKLLSSSKKVKKSLVDNYKLSSVLMWFGLPLVITWLTSLFIPNYQPFRLLLILPAFYLILSFGISLSTTSMIYIIEVIFVLALNLGGLIVYYRNPYFHREDWRGLANFIKKRELPLIISAKAFDWPLVYYRADEKVIPVLEDLRTVNKEDQNIFFNKIKRERLLAYTPYLADVYDPSRLATAWLEEVGFVKIKEVNFNQIPLWVYEKSEQ